MFGCHVSRLGRPACTGWAVVLQNPEGGSNL